MLLKFGRYVNSLEVLGTNSISTKAENPRFQPHSFTRITLIVNASE